VPLRDGSTGLAPVSRRSATGRPGNATPRICRSVRADTAGVAAFGRDLMCAEQLDVALFVPGEAAFGADGSIGPFADVT
jgi:hypothetical protein